MISKKKFLEDIVVDTWQMSRISIRNKNRMCGRGVGNGLKFWKTNDLLYCHLVIFALSLALFIFRPYFIWERKIFKSNGFFFFFFFFLQNLPRFYLYLNLRVLPIEFNPHKFSFVRYVFVEIFEVFLKNDENDENDPLMTK